MTRRLTATDLRLPNLWSIRKIVGPRHPMVSVLRAHNRMLVQLQATPGNWGWVIDETGICSKTSKGYLTTTAEGSKLEPYEKDYWKTST